LQGSYSTTLEINERKYDGWNAEGKELDRGGAKGTTAIPNTALGNQILLAHHPHALWLALTWNLGLYRRGGNLYFPRASLNHCHDRMMLPRIEC
jgi:hypothetical protein